MRGKTILRYFLLLVLLGLSLDASASHPQTMRQVSPTPNPKRVLVLCAYGYTIPDYQEFNPALLSVMQTAGIQNDHIFFEYLDLLHLKDKEQRRAQVDMLRDKYADLDIDLIVTVHSPALSFLLDEAKDIFPNVPVISWTVQGALDHVDTEHRIVLLWDRLDEQGTLEEALQLFPETSRVLFVSGDSEEDSQLERQAKNVFANWEGKLQFEYTSGYSVEEVLQRVSNLPPRTVIIYCTVFRDKTGRIFTPRDVGRMIAKAANAPVFGLYDTLLGLGVTGGSMENFEADGVQAGKLAIDILNGKVSLSEQLTTVVCRPVPMFDWQQIEKWGGDVSKLPAGTIFINRTPSIWKQYGRYLIAFIGFSLAQSFLIISLLLQRRRRRAAEEALERHLEHLEELVEDRTEHLAIQREWLQVTLTSIGDAVIATDAEGRVTFINPVAAALTGWEPEDAVGQPVQSVFQIINEQSRQVAENIVERVLREGRIDNLANHTALVTRHGRKIPIEDSAAPIRDREGGVSGVVLVFHDVTERRRGQEALRESLQKNEFLANIINIGAQPFRVEYPDGRLGLVNSAFEHLTGYSSEELQSISCAIALTPPEWLPIERQKLEELHLTGKPVRYEKEYIRKDNSRVPVELLVHVVTDSDRKPQYYYSFITDITESKRAEERLQEYEKVVEGLEEMIAVVDRDYRYLIANRAFLNYRDRERWQVVGSLVTEVLDSEVFDNDIRKKLDECFQGNIIKYEMKYNYPKLGERVLSIAYFPIEGPTGVDRVACVMQDITERKLLEKELRRSRDDLELRIQERTAELELANEKLRSVPSRLITVQENERKRLAGDLHDSIGQTLAALKFRIEHVIIILKKRESRQALQLLQDFVPILQHSIDETRTIYMGLKPTILSDYGILATLEWYRLELLKVYPNQHIELTTAIREEDIPEDLKTTIFRVVQEALNNTLKHGRSEWVDVRLAVDGGAIELEISDDGVGMDLDYIIESSAAKSLGLIGMRERTEFTGGEFTITSAPNKGTTIKAIWRNHLNTL
ncbi:MAG: PAS domain S-box protein [Syntrophobacteraceae bacterium]